MYDKNKPHKWNPPELGYIYIMARKGRSAALKQEDSAMVDKWQHVIDNVIILRSKYE